MGSFKDRIFSEIRNDYKTNKEKSFLYGYIFENELSDAEKNSKDTRAVDAKVKKLALGRLYDIGYPVNENKSKRKGKNTALNILDAYIAETGISSDDSDLDFYQELYEQLNDMKNTTALIPVRVDVKTGIGFYIIGMENYYRFPGTYIKSRKTCGIGFISNWLGGYPGDEDVLLTLEREGLKDPPNIVEANQTYIKYVLRDDYRYRSYREFNGNWPKGKKLPKKFWPYFGTEEDAYDLGDLSDEEIAEKKQKQK